MKAEAAEEKNEKGSTRARLVKRVVGLSLKGSICLFCSKAALSISPSSVGAWWWWIVQWGGALFFFFLHENRYRCEAETEGKAKGEVRARGVCERVDTDITSPQWERAAGALSGREREVEEESRGEGEEERRRGGNV